MKVKYGLLLFCAPAVAEVPTEEWVWQSLHLIDTMQTIRIAQHPNQYEEYNPILGKHPSTGAVVAWGAGTAILHYVVADQLEKHGYSAKPFEYLTIGFAAGNVYLNWRWGLNP